MPIHVLNGLRSKLTFIIDQTISCLSGSKGEILIGTTSGDVIAFSEDDLTQINRFTNVFELYESLLLRITHYACTFLTM